LGSSKDKDDEEMGVMVMSDKNNLVLAKVASRVVQSCPEVALSLSKVALSRSKVVLSCSKVVLSRPIVALCLGS
jgi:hypothetical protein